ncbi:MAG: hypothetical protein O3A78_02320 [Nitrospinae bacterium]|jgi:hypothetical protein|nr:hypothetical protein [Nitrospinota bacterium]MDA1108642.1 hypothetical protein [Nitrospinota bacterium]
MFFEVRIFDADGELKRVLSPKKLSKKYWKEKSEGMPDYIDQDVNMEDMDRQKTWGKSNIQMDETSV